MLTRYTLVMVVVGIFMMAMVACGAESSTPLPDDNSMSTPMEPTKIPDNNSMSTSVEPTEVPDNNSMSTTIEPTEVLSGNSMSTTMEPTEDLVDNSMSMPMEPREVPDKYKVAFGTPLGVEYIVFDSTDGNGDQIRFTLDTEAQQHTVTVEADLIIEELGGRNGRITVLLDTPEVRTVSFTEDKSVRIYNPALRTPFFTVPILGSDPDTFAFFTKIHLSIDVDLVEGSWSIIVTEGDQTLMHFTGPFEGTQVKSVRFTTPVVQNPDPAKAMIGNIVIDSQ